MSKPTNTLVRACALLVFALFMTSGTAWAQFYVAPGATGGGGSAADPGQLQDAIDGVNANTVSVISFAPGNYIAGTDADRSFELQNDVTFTGTPVGTLTTASLVGFNVIQLGNVEPDRDDPFDDTAITVTLADDFDLELRGVAEMRFAFTEPDGDGSDPTNDVASKVVAGGSSGGTLIVSTNGTTNLAVDSAPGRAVVQRLLVENGTARVEDNQLEQFIGSVAASLHIFDDLQVVDGATLDLDTQDLYLTFDLGDVDPTWEIDDDSEVISNNGSAFLVVVDDDASDETFSTTGAGLLNANLNIPYSEANDPGENDYDIFVTFSQFGITSSTIGGEVDDALQYFVSVGTGETITDTNNDATTDPQVRFTNLTSIEGDLILDGTATPNPDDISADVFNWLEDVNDQDGTAVAFNMGGTLNGRLLHNEGAVNLFGPWTIVEEATLADGYFRLDASGLSGGIVGATVFEDLVTAEANGSGETDYMFLLDNTSGGTHNLQFNGDLDFFASPITAFNTSLNVFPVDPRDDYSDIMGDTQCPNPDVAPVNQSGITGNDGINVPNKVLLAGSDDQELFIGTQWVVRYLEVDAEGGADVEIDDDSDSGIILAAISDSGSNLNDEIAEAYVDGIAPADADASSFLNIYSTRFTTNGFLDANGTAQITLRWTSADGRGLLLAGEADEAYSDIDGDGFLYPISIRYEGDTPIFTGDELPGDASGRDADDDVVAVERLQIAMDIPDPTITIGKDIVVTENLDLPRGQLAVGSASVLLENAALLSIGDGNIVPSQGFPVNGRLVFPNDPEFEAIAGFAPAFTDGGNFDVSEDGIDLYFYPSMDRVVQLEYPSGENEVIRDVTVNTPASVSLRREDARIFQVNRDVCVADGVFDIEDNTYIINAVNGVDTQVYVDTNGNLTDDFWTGDSAADKAAQRDRFATASLKNQALAADGGADDALAAKMMEALSDLSGSSIDFAAKTQQDDEVGVFGAFGTMYFTGTERTDVIVETEDSPADLVRTLPAQEIFRVGNDDDASDATITYGSDGNILLEDDDTLTPLDILETPRVRIFDANDGDSPVSEEGVGVLLCTSLDILNIYGDLYQEMGEFAAAVECYGYSNDDATAQNGMSFPIGVTDETPDDGFWYQRIEVGLDRDMSAGQMGDYTLLDGEWYGNGIDLYVRNTSQIGVLDDVSTAHWDGSPYTWHYSLGDFYVGMDEEESPGLYLGGPCRTSRDQAETCGSDDADNTRSVRNSYIQGGFNAGLDADVEEDGPGILWMSGENYTFLGTGDRFEDAFVPGIQQGLDGLVAFIGDLEQFVTQRQDEDAFFNNVLMSGDPGITLLTYMWSNYTGTVNLQLGNIKSEEDELYELVVLNPMQEEGFVGRNSALNQYISGFGDGARDSYVAADAPIRRIIDAQEDRNTGGDVTTAYYFPHGTLRPDIPGLPQGREFFLPLLLSFNQDQGESTYARSTLESSAVAEELADVFEPIRVDAAGPSQDGIVEDGLLLNALSPIFYRVEFFRSATQQEPSDDGPNADIPSEDPNIRISADGLAGVSNIKRIRIVHFSCDDTDGDGEPNYEFLGLAGVYDLFRDDVDDTSFNNNDFINGIPNLIQEGANVRQCNIFAIAANGFENPIDAPLGAGDANETTARAQIIHDAPSVGNVDIYVDEDFVQTLSFDDLSTKATPFGAIPAGEAEVAVVPEGGDLADAALTATLTLQAQEQYVIFATEDGDGNVSLDVVEGARLEASSDGVVDARVRHDVGGAPAVTVLALDPFSNNDPVAFLARNLAYAETSGYSSLDPTAYNVEVSADGSVLGAFFFQLDSYAGQALNCFASEYEGLTVLCATVTGEIIAPDVTTDDENPTELPTEFALDGNYPNPFNPSTTIQFDLPETAEVSVQVVDMLGRQVMTLPAQTMQAGADRQIQVNASNLASGVYVYRIVVKTADSNPEFKTGRMTLIK